jgi:hypothetical protein
MGRSRSERRAASGAVSNLYAAETTLGWRVIDQVPMSLGAEKVARGKWREVFYEDGGFAGWQVLPAQACDRGGKKIPSREGTPATITLAEVQRNAGLFGRSRTLGQPEWKRLRRHAKYDKEKILAPEDAIERAIRKVQQWPFPASRIATDDDGKPVFGDRAIRVYPKPPGK